MRRAIRIIKVGLVIAALAACTSHPPRVNCEEHLLPINKPAPVTAAPERKP